MMIPAATTVLGIDSRSQNLSGHELVAALRRGGFVIVMRHASSPRLPPDKQIAAGDNVNLERQLDAAGRGSAIAMGDALSRLKIPIGRVLTSSAYRARETARLAKLPNPVSIDELGDNGQSMQGVPPAQTAWLQKTVTQFPTGSVTFLLTHMPNIAAAFPALATGVADGEGLVFGPDGKGGATLVARIKIEDWPQMK